MTARFGQNLWVSAALHAALIAMLFSPVVFRNLFRPKPDLSIPIEFVVEVPDSMLKQADTRGMTLSEQIPDKKKVKEEKKKDDVNEAKKSAVQVSNKIVVREVNKKNAKSTRKLTEDEVRKMLAAGATAGNYTSIPEGDVLYVEIIRRACYGAWNQPTYDEVKDAVAVVTLRFMGDGTIVGAALTKKTGIPAMDISVMEAVNSLKRIEGLSADYLRNCDYSVDVRFRVLSQ